ncbi:TPA: hypothetical protein KE178_004983 [Escherichia coli]|uniref:hypothetical protein n=1 Tax=Escherichia coli TaxID=562 RepID=UPI001A3EDAC1|nr:hypothetical protein [Escherichia coli]VVZ35101.1 Uncharacterised protein [Escherichia coli]HBC8437109.1 hypothetical protein [Escherichia coli]
MKMNIVKFVDYVLQNKTWSLHDVQVEDVGEVRVFCYDPELNEITDLSKCFNIFMAYELNKQFYSIDMYLNTVTFRISEYDNFNEDYYIDENIEFNVDDINTEEKFFQYCLVNNTLGLTFDDISAILKVQRLIPEEVLNPLND